MGLLYLYFFLTFLPTNSFNTTQHLIARHDTHYTLYLHQIPSGHKIEADVRVRTAQSVIHSKTYCGYVKPQIILNAIYNVI